MPLECEGVWGENGRDRYKIPLQSKVKEKVNMSWSRECGTLNGKATCWYASRKRKSHAETTGVTQSSLRLQNASYLETYKKRIREYPRLSSIKSEDQLFKTSGFHGVGNRVLACKPYGVIS